MSLKPPAYAVSKVAADYSKGMANAHCSLCTHFTYPDKCSVVEGRVAPAMWCKYFQKEGSIA